MIGENQPRRLANTVTEFLAGLHREPWMARAGCRKQDADPDLWFAGAEGTNDTWATRRALGICRYRCPVIEDCLRYAMADRTLRGIWGGTTELERRAVHRRLLAREQAARLANPERTTA